MGACIDCIHFRRLPGDTPFRRRTGCYHPELMEQKQAERFNAAQEIPGDHEKLNLNGDCPKFTARRRRSLIGRFVDAMKD